jgi:hypothetical protein
MALGEALNIFHLVIAALMVCVIIWVGYRISVLKYAPPPPTNDYDGVRHLRKGLFSDTTFPPTTPINRFAVATANYGGVMTDASTSGGFIGIVTPEAARLQVDAGARAIIFDVWPDTADRDRPTVATMANATDSLMVTSGGLDKGVGRYSQWKMLTRNSAPLGDIMKAAVDTAFTGPQSTDPFFVVLKLHGTMSVSYLNTMGNIVRSVIGGHAMGGNWNKCANQSAVNTEPVSSFRSKVFLIVIPEIQPGYDPLPNVKTYGAFMNTYRTTTMWEPTNAMEMTQPNTILFEPSGLGAITATTEVNGVPQTIAQTGLCVVQPSTGGRSSTNAALFNDASYLACLQSGAQMVAINLLGQSEGDETLKTFFDKKNFGVHSFRLIQ